MADIRREYRYYMACHQTPALITAYRQRSLPGVEAYLQDQLPPNIAKTISVKDLPSGDVVAAGDEKLAHEASFAAVSDRDRRPLLVAITIDGKGNVEAIAKAVRAKKDAFVAGGADLLIGHAEHWCPHEAIDPIFGDRHAALRLIRLSKSGVGNLSGRGVNVVIVDQGIDRNQIEQRWGPRYGGGWDVAGVQHGTVASPHGMMIARNVLAVAPQATLYDLPLIPERILDLPTYLSTAHATLDRVRNEIAYAAPWVFVNAWSVFDRRLDSPYDPYCSDGSHLFFGLIADISTDGHDIVFCAGNCGQFCADGRCGPTTVGPGQSIVGANSHPKVLTVGAVRTDGLWLGYSSQGPGQDGLCVDKPDLCAPSQFRDNDDAAKPNTGTSAAAAIAAGVIAAFRERWTSGVVPPEQLVRVLRGTAHSGRSGPWAHRLGSGILDASRAYAELESKYSGSSP